MAVIYARWRSICTILLGMLMQTSSSLLYVYSGCYVTFWRLFMWNICPSYTFVLVHFSLYSLVLEGVLCFICSSFALLCIRFIEAAQWHFLYHGPVFFLIKKTTFCLCKKKEKKKRFRKLAQDDHIWRAGSLALKCKVKHTFLLDYDIMYERLIWNHVTFHTFLKA